MFPNVPLAFPNVPERATEVARNSPFAGPSESPLTDSNRRPPHYRRHLLTMRCETVAVGCHWLPLRLIEPLSAASHLRPVATGCARLAP
jgi:hypothetical protein